MLKELLPYAKKYKKEFILGCICVIAECVFELVVPILIADIIDKGVLNKDGALIIRQSLLMMLCSICAYFLGILYARYAAIAGQGFGAELRKDEFKRIQNFSFGNTDHFSTSSLITRLTSDVTIIQNTISNAFRPFLRSPIMLFLALFFTFKINAKLAMIFICTAPILGIGLVVIVRKVGPLFQSMQRQMDRLNTVIQENLKAMRVVKSYVREDYEKEKFEKINEELKNSSQKAFRTSVWNLPLFQGVMYTTIVCILFFGGQMVLNDSMQVGELTGFLSYVLQILNSLMMMSNVFLMFTRSIASGERIIEVLHEVPEIEDPQSDLIVEKGDIEFKNVSFKYKKSAQEYVLSNINLKIPHGSTIGILGGTGSAKSSLVQLIPRLYDVSDGEILIDGHNVKEYSLKHLRDSIGMVLQKNMLFSGSIKENLLWGDKNASDKDIEWASEISRVDEFIDHLSDGYETDLGQGGVNVSGGQKQRLCIARALLKKPKVLILDDSTSAVDTATESHIKEALEKLTDTTKIIIAQRVTSVEHADSIVILEDGHINAIGSHEQLLKENKIYQDIYHSQQKGVDL